MEMKADVLIFCEGRLLVRAGTLEPAGLEAVAGRGVAGGVELSPEGGRAVRLAGGAGAAPEGFAWARVRQLIAEGSLLAGRVCRALGLLNWRAECRFCARCGGQLGEHPTELARVCGGCGWVAYPSVEPAVIVRVEREGRILLARHVQRIPELYACLAGYIEVGESAEGAVRREVREEVGLELGEVEYVGSQAWPFPYLLMMAFRAQWKAGELRLQADEIADAQWFEPSDLPAIPPPGTTAYRLITDTF